MVRILFRLAQLILVALLSTLAVADDTDPPVLNAISVDKVTVDVTEGPQTLTFTVDVTDESGINWSAGVNNTGMVLQDAGG